MANKDKHRQFGYVRKLASGRYQASYLTATGERRYGPGSFERKRDANQWLSVQESEVARGEWIDPNLGKVTLAEFGDRWLDHHHCARRTREEYRSIWRLHIKPFLGRSPLDELTTDAVRAWRATLLSTGRSEDRTAKAYRLLHTVMATAVDDGKIKRNPCRIRGAGQHRTPERPIASIGEVFALADAVPTRYRAFILAAAFTGLRWGELVALRRCDLDLAARTLRVQRSLSQTQDGTITPGLTKSRAGVRTVALPELLVNELLSHIDTCSEPGPTGLIFTNQRGGPLRRGNFHRDTSWTRLVVNVGLPEGFHFHDLRHTGNHLAAMSGASTRELMRRMGHASMRAALIYQHATDDRDRTIADRMNAHVHHPRAPSVDDR